MATEILTSISKDERERALFRSRRMWQMDMEHDRAVERKEALVYVAKNLLSMGLSVEDVAKGTGLSRAEIEVLRQQLTAN
ncbi:MAG: hypothetical protein LBK23_00225 [Oscillospiraceae bacterium]|jgi:hypothetical protein|nr:hypothetical protein [Oscillospiraceae bacterium]